MSETFDTQTETSNIQLNAEAVGKALKKRRIKGMSRRKKAISLLIILLVLAAAGFGIYKNLPKNEGADFSTATISKMTITESIEATGTLNPIKQSEMGFKNDDTITAINVEPGDHVKAGQVLARQDPTTLETALQQAESTVEQDQLSVQSAQLSFESSSKTLERQQKLFDAGALAQSDLDTARDSYRKSELELAVAKAKLANDQSKVDQAQSDLEGTALIAPFDGIIGAVNGQVGQINGINSSTSTLLSIMSEDLEMSALINEADISRIKVGQEVEFTTSAYSNKTFKGKVLRITPQAQTVSNIQYYPILISCIDPDHQLLSGMSVSANIIIARQTDVPAVPMMAISYAQSYLKTNPSSLPTAKSQPARSGTRPEAGAIPDGQKASASGASDTAGTPGKVVVMQNNQPVVKDVILGLSDGSYYEVISGLEEGDVVILGSNQISSESTSTERNSGNNSRNQRQNGGGMGGGMGGPPPGM